MAGGKRLSPEARRAALLDAGLRLFGAHAYDALSSDELAKRAGISKGLFYHYFGNKRGFYLATIREVADRLLAVTDPRPDGPFDAALEGSLAGFVGFVAEHPTLFRSLVRGGIGSDPEAVAVIEDVRETSVERVVARAGLGRPDPALRLRLYGWVAFTEGVCLDWSSRRDLDEAAVVKLIADALYALLQSAQEN